MPTLDGKTFERVALVVLDSLGYYPTNKDQDGKRRHITIEVKNHPDYVITSRKSYYAPEP